MPDVYSPYKAPKGWQPTSDQKQQIQRDSRLQRMSQDDLYMYFNNQKGGGNGTGTISPMPSYQSPTPGGAHRDPASKPAQANGIWGWIDSVRQALGGS